MAEPIAQSNPDILLTTRAATYKNYSTIEPQGLKISSVSSPISWILSCTQICVKISTKNSYTKSAQYNTLPMGVIHGFGATIDLILIVMTTLKSKKTRSEE